MSELGKLTQGDALQAFIRRHPELVRSDFVEALSDTVVKQVRVDADAALALARASCAIADELGEERDLAQAEKAMGNAFYGLGEYRVAVDRYEQSAARFEACGENVEQGRALSTSIQARILLGDYDSAADAAERARTIFEKIGDRKRLAILDNNVGNIMHRQDRFHEALAMYERAYRTLAELQDTNGVAAALSNVTLCLIMLNDFPRALEIHREAREVCEELGMPRLVARADYNIAYLYYLRGEYSRSTEMLNTARQLFKRSSDEYHVALCDMHQAEIYIDLNLHAEASRLASRARKQFAKLGTGYEQAKSMALEAIALSNQGKILRGLDLFEKARESFVREKNQVWPWMIDLYRAFVYGDEGRLIEARQLARRVLPIFEEAGLGAKAIVCRLLLARLALRIGDWRAARKDCEKALERASAIDSPLYVFQARFQMGEIEEAAGHTAEAIQSFEASAKTLESLRSSLQREEMKIAFLRNRLGVYESLVDLCLKSAPGTEPRTELDLDAKEKALYYIEQSKARALVDLILGSIRGRPHASGESEFARTVQKLREELNWYYRRIEHEQLSRESFNLERLEELTKTARARETELLDALRELPAGDGRFGSLRDTGRVSLARIQEALGPNRSLIEYYIARGRVYACVITQSDLVMRPLGDAEHVKNTVRRLQFQISKFQLPRDYLATFESSIHEATVVHLNELYESLVGPLVDALRGSELVIVPHAFMHYLPFHAFYDGRRYVVDDYAVSYAPSATVFVHCHELPAAEGNRSLILGIPDRTAPFILDEVHAVADAVSEPEVLLGSEASLKALREKAPGSRLMHIATHGYYRKDNPMFSAIRLGDSYLSLYDLYELSLPVDLVTVSACATGLSVVVEGDEILGLVRGLLFAGARSLVATLWNVQDRATADLMGSFYSHLRTEKNRAVALRYAMLQQRERSSQPFFWASHVLVGKVEQG